MNTSVGFVTTGVDGRSVPTLSDCRVRSTSYAIRTETSAADIGTREAGASAPAPSHAAPAAAPWHRRRLLRTQLDRDDGGTGRCRTNLQRTPPRARWRRARTDSADAARHRTSPPTG
ncbi:hypothetical protein GTA28_28790 [Rhodococcus hoagii]|nr:hypothetical protein [Prescottella equi]